MNFIETHSHLIDEKFNQDRESVIKKIYASGIDKIVEISCMSKEWAKALKLCQSYKGRMFCAFGVHPEYAENISEEEKEELKKYLAMPEAVAVGEIGIDYWWEVGTRDSQKQLLSSQLELCSVFNKPAVFHARNGKKPEQNAYADLLSVLNNWKYSPKKRFRGVLHCFSGDEAQAKEALSLGLALGVNGTITYKRNGAIRDIIKKAGAQNIVLETDCPYLPPEGYRGERNDSSFIPEIAVFTASYLGISASQLAEITTKNACDLFGI